MSRSKVFKRQFQALPPYFGGKRALCLWIFGLLAQIIPVSLWQELIFLDAFTGGGAVSLYAKAQGFKSILSNDWSLRSQLIGMGLLANSTVYLTPTDFLWLNQPLPPEALPGFIEQHYASSVFSTRHARRLDQWRYWAMRIQCPTKRALALLLIWHCTLEFVCFATSLGTSNRPYAEALDGLRTWDGMNPKRFSDKSIQGLLKPTQEVLEAKLKVLNPGVFGGSPVQLYQQDACQFLTQVSGDIVYMDPPYADTLGYEKANQVLDHILSGQELQIETSPFSSGTDALHALLDSASHIPTWVLSYGSKAVSLDELVALVKQHAGTRTVVGYARNYTHMAHVSKTKTHQEYLVIAHNA